MDLDPHILQQILLKIRQQMRCPQCGKNVPVDIENIQVVSEESMLLHLHCDGCAAHIVLYASLQGLENITIEHKGTEVCANVSSTLQVSENDMSSLRNALEKSGGSFSKMFDDSGSTDS